MKALWIKFAAVTAIIVLLSFILESPFRKGGTDSNYPIYVLITTFIVGCTYLWDRNLFMKKEIVVFSFSISAFALISAYFSTIFVLEKLYGFDYEISLTELNANLIFFMMVNSILMLSTFGIVSIKNKQSH